MLNKIGYFIGKFIGVALYVLIFCGGLAMLKLAVYLLKWVFYGTFII